MKKITRFLVSIFFTLCASNLSAEDLKKQKRFWTDPEKAAKEHPSFNIQGEYLYKGEPLSIGAQIQAIRDQEYRLFFYKNGLPGAGWEPGNQKTEFKGILKDDRVEIIDQEGKVQGFIKDGFIHPNGENIKLKKTTRQSPTLGKKPPEGSVVLFREGVAKHWKKDPPNMQGEYLGVDNMTSYTTGSYHLHAEFRTPYMPYALGQKRGNSGIYHSGRYETQVLDSFGLEPKPGHCGGIYSIAKPKLNMCLPPLTWQTYDVDFTAAKFDEDGKRTHWPRITVKLNGVIVHDDLELNKDFTAAAPINKPLTSPTGPVYFQNHNDPVAYRNIWILPKDE